MKAKEVVFFSGVGILAFSGIYLGFVKKNFYGLTWFEQLGKTKYLNQINRPVAISIIERASGGNKMQGNYDDDYLISRAIALLLKNDYFYIGDRKFVTKTGKETR